MATLTADNLAEHYLTNMANGTGFLINPLVFWVRPGSAFLQTVHAAARRLGFLSLYLNLGQDQTDDSERQLQKLIDKALGWRGAQPWNTTLAGKLDLLRERKRKKIVLLIEDADRAWESEMGRNMMFALKAAREQLNLGRGEIGLLLMLAGADEAGLRWLVRGNDAPFLGASLKELPQGVDVG